jgi:hypothetical protein
MPASHPCLSVRPHFSDHLDAQPLPFWTRLSVGLHLAICPPCRRVQRSLVATREALHGLRDVDVDAGADVGDGRP